MRPLPRLSLNTARAAVAAAALALPAPTPALAQAQAQTGWAAYLSALTPERLIQTAMQIGISALRSQADIVYGDMTVRAATGQVVISDISAWPFFDWIDTECQIDIDRITLRGTAIDDPDTMRLKLSATGVTLPGGCLPPEPRQMLSMLGLDAVTLPRLSADMTYDFPSSGAALHVFAGMAGVANIAFDADIDYMALEAFGGMDEPEPFFLINRAALTVENLGGWEAFSPMIPLPLADPAQGPLVMNEMLRGMLNEMNGTNEDGTAKALNPAQADFLTGAAATWSAFLARPERLALETDIDPVMLPLYLDFDGYDDDAQLMFEDLRPQLVLAPAPARAMLPAATLRAALTGAALSPEDRLSAGLALLTGTGAPRNVDAGIGLLEGLAREGHAEAALELSRVLEHRDAEAAYRWALIAGASGARGAAARLDRLETRLPFTSVLALQQAASAEVQHPIEALARVDLIREQALARMSGRGEARSYGIAAMWAMIGAAAGDAVCTDILDELDERLRLEDDAARAYWAPIEANASQLAAEVWIGQDLPGRLGAN